jgi:hypothetical protein
MDAVDDDSTAIVEQDVHRLRAAGDNGRGGVFRLEGQTEGSGEVVAGSQWQEGERPPGEVVPTVQRRHDRMQAAVTASHDDGPRTRTLEYSVEIVSIVGRLDDDVGAGAQDSESAIDAGLRGAARR